jgi:hypothetical protein
LLVLLDGLDAITAHNQAHSLSWLPEQLPPNCYLVLTARNDQHAHVLAGLQRRLKPGQFACIEPLRLADGERAMETLLAGACASDGTPSRARKLNALSVFCFFLFLVLFVSCTGR